METQNIKSKSGTHMSELDLMATISSTFIFLMPHSSHQLTKNVNKASKQANKKWETMQNNMRMQDH